MKINLICYGGTDGEEIGRRTLEFGQSVAIPDKTRVVQLFLTTVPAEESDG